MCPADIEWGPRVDAEACTGCGACIEFCRQGVYAWSDDGRTIAVAHKTHCVTGCSHCASLCEAEAIAFPSLEDLRRARREI